MWRKTDCLKFLSRQARDGLALVCRAWRAERVARVTSVTALRNMHNVLGTRYLLRNCFVLCSFD